MSSSSRIIFVLIINIALCITTTFGQFTIPNIEIQALNPKGFRVSIPDVPGIKLFGFHGKINANAGAQKPNEINGDVTAPRNGRWIYENMDVQLKQGDNINYWVFVQHDAFGYRKEDQKYTVTKLVAPNTPWTKTPKPTPTQRPNKPPNNNNNCAPSVTTINDGRSTCKGEVVFQEIFKDASLNRSKWIIEQRFPSDELENEFVSYQPRSVSSTGGKLKITPYLLSKIYPFNDVKIIDGTLDLTKGCTASEDIYCKLDTIGYDILPPVVSGKVSSRNLFSFKYGRIDIRAKLPIGDWLYPELFLESSRQRYGTAGYNSGQMRVAFSRGNRELQTETERLDNTQLSGGIMLGVYDDCRTAEMKKTYHTDSLWGADYHTYSMIWRPESIEMLVDNVSYGTILPGFRDHYKNNICPSLNTTSQRWSAGSSMAPYDQEFYISLGLGVGGVADFPDNVGEKMWKNKSRKAKHDFFTYSQSWYEQLDDDNKCLFVDSIKVTAL